MNFALTTVLIDMIFGMYIQVTIMAGPNGQPYVHVTYGRPFGAIISVYHTFVRDTGRLKHRISDMLRNDISHMYAFAIYS